VKLNVSREEMTILNGESRSAAMEHQIIHSSFNTRPYPPKLDHLAPFD
jgi:hypothetical protein